MKLDHGNKSLQQVKNQTVVDPYVEDFTSEETITAPYPEHVAMVAGVEDETAGIHSQSAPLARRGTAAFPFISPLSTFPPVWTLLARTPSDPFLPFFFLL